MNGLERLPKRKEFARWVPKLKEATHETEHYRVYADPEVRSNPVENVAVVVLKDGRAFVGRSKCGPKDRWSSRRGFAVAMGRALKRASRARLFRDFDFCIQETPLPGGVELRDLCRERLGL